MDALDQLTEFIDGLPAWVGDDGYPLSWRHFIYGLQYIRRKHARVKIDMASTARIARGTEEQFQGWRNEMSTLAGI